MAASLPGVLVAHWLGRSLLGQSRPCRQGLVVDTVSQNPQTCLHHGAGNTMASGTCGTLASRTIPECHCPQLTYTLPDTDTTRCCPHTRQAIALKTRLPDAGSHLMSLWGTQWVHSRKETHLRDTRWLVLHPDPPQSGLQDGELSRC